MCCVSFLLPWRSAELLQKKTFVQFKIPRRRGQSPIPFCLSPDPVSQLFPGEPVFSRPFPLWQLSGVPAASVCGCLPLPGACRMLQQLLPKGLNSCSGSGLEGFPPPFFLSYFVLFVFSLLLFNLHIPELSYWTAPPPSSCQTPLQGDLQSQQETNNVEEKFQSVFRETCYFKGSSKVPLELITVVSEIRQGGSCSAGSWGMKKMEKKKIKNKSPYEVQFNYFF